MECELKQGGPVESELLIKKSRFLGRVIPVSGRAEAYAEVARLKALHPGAVHVCSPASPAPGNGFS